jgi:hypothetical protein
VRRLRIVVWAVFMLVLSACGSQEADPISEEQTEAAVAGDSFVGINACLTFYQVALVEMLSEPVQDYAALQGFMGDTFEVTIWPGSAEQLSPEEAVALLEDTLLPPGSQITFPEDADIEALLGVDPYTLYPDAVGFMFSRGWGAEGADEAVLIYNWGADGNHYWRGILLARGGFAPLPSDETAAGGR